VKILLFGANGQVGWELQRSLAPLGQIKACDRREADFINLDRLREIIREYSPDVIVNAAAYTAVDKAEDDLDIAYCINAEAVGLLGGEAKRLNAWLIHYSTDYVFDGTKSGPYLENDQPNPLSVYGKTKLKGEEAICESGCKYLIFRTSWVYSAHGSNFAKTILRLAKERDVLNVVADQIGAPTSAELIADITALALYRIIGATNSIHPQGSNPLFSEQAIGIYHLTPTGETSWFGFAKYLLKEAQKCGIDLRINPENVHPITTADYPVPAKRPANSRLNTNKLTEVFGVSLPQWQSSIDRLVMALTQQKII
jgi:dTDP-4-dehydrorhamnose reductase